MALSYVRKTANEEEFVSPKQREHLAEQKAQCMQEIDKRLALIPEDSYDRPELERKRDDIFTRFPTIPVDLSIWRVAYYEDWLKAYNRVRGLDLN